MEAFINLFEGALVEQDLYVPFGGKPKMVPAARADLEILRELLGVQDFAAALAFVEDIGRQIPPIIRL